MRRSAALLAAVLVLIGPGPVVTEGAQAGPRKVGLLIADHGEPPEYNADTYEVVYQVNPSSCAPSRNPTSRQIVASMSEIRAISLEVWT